MDLKPARGGIGFSWRHREAVESLDQGPGVELVKVD